VVSRAAGFRRPNAEYGPLTPLQGVSVDTGV
jgi:hypothetical protein